MINVRLCDSGELREILEVFQQKEPRAFETLANVIGTYKFKRLFKKNDYAV